MKKTPLMLLLAVCSCTAEPATQPGLPALPVDQQPLPAMPDGHPDLGALSVLSRGPRRLSVDQLEHTLDAIGQLPKGTVKLPENLALTLGRPDFLQVTEESLDPTPLFMKFMMDLGAYYCGAVGDADPNRPADQRVLTRFADREQNLRYLLLRFTGIDGPDAAPYVARLSGVFEAGRQGAKGDPSGWQSVCLAIFTSPEFLLY